MTKYKRPWIPVIKHIRIKILMKYNKNTINSPKLNKSLITSANLVIFRCIHIKVWLNSIICGLGHISLKN